MAYENLLSFELLEDGQSIIKGGLGNTVSRAIAGSLIFGVVGDVIDGVTGKKKNSRYCNSMKLRISLKNTHIDMIYINFITIKIKVESFTYSIVQDSAQRCITLLKTINDINRNEFIQFNPSPSSSAYEIVNLKISMKKELLHKKNLLRRKKNCLEFNFYI